MTKKGLKQPWDLKGPTKGKKRWSVYVKGSHCKHLDILFKILLINLHNIGVYYKFLSKIYFC